LILDDGFLVALLAGVAPRAGGVILRGPQLDPVQRGPRLPVARIGARDLGVFDDRAIVVVRALRLTAVAQAGGSGAPGCRECGDRDGGEHDAAHLSGPIQHG
jgi:hypothetical protein